MRSFLRIALVNTVLTGFMLALLVVGLPLAWDIRNAIRTGYPDGRGQLSVYKDDGWAPKHFIEFNSLRSEYRDFIVWRRLKFDGETIHIDNDGYRRHGSREGGLTQARIWLFGGSAMWGTGSRDEQTIPANLERIAGRRTFNLGESGYEAHQSLNLLMKLIVEGGRPEDVIFYDGVNEIETKCRSSGNFYATVLDPVVREAMRERSSEYLNIERVVLPLRELIAAVVQRGASDVPTFNCHLDEEKADLIARALVADWVIAKSISTANGARFTAVLQPVAFIGAPRLSHLPEVAANYTLKKQYEVVYSKIRAELARANIPYLDLTAIFDGNDMLYIDFCHVVPTGNQIVAAALAPLLR